MLFSSIEFLIFLTIFITCIVLFRNYQRSVIIIFSLFFYSYWDFHFIPLIVFFCISTFYLVKKNYFLPFSIFIIIFPLIFFKYSSFIFETFNINFLLKYSYKGELPLAISFLTFTAIAVLIDRKNKVNDEYNLFNISEYLLYFPQLIAGPILRLNQLAPQLNNKILFLKDNIKFGLILFCVGYIKKVYFADNIATYIDPFFQNPSLTESKDLIKAFLLFPIQIYFDFSGYVDMALGVSKMLGINLPKNFNKPYFAISITDFWRRWHITLSNWFKDYLYIPLGGSRVVNFRIYVNLIITMAIAGLWHGASFNFILWGFLNGILLTAERFFKVEKFTYSLFKNLFYCFLIFNLWLVFRISDFSLLQIFFEKLYINFFEIFMFENLIVVSFVLLSVMTQKVDNYDFLKDISKKVDIKIVIPFFITIILVGFSLSFGQSEKFIYFQF
jgi:alginate O-acetyltransferase complex protein AlgI